jgi:hypothetical protein
MSDRGCSGIGSKKNKLIFFILLLFLLELEYPL